MTRTLDVTYGTAKTMVATLLKEKKRSMRPSEIEDELNLDRYVVSFALNELKSEGLVEYECYARTK